MDFVVAIPSYKRAAVCNAKTLALLRRHGLIDRTTVFIVPEELEDYKRHCPDVALVCGVRGVAAQRRVITATFPERRILFLDDDLEDLIGLDRRSIPSLKEMAERGFARCEAEGCRFWGVLGVPNPYFMSPEPSTHLLFCIGCCYGVINRGPEPFVPIDLKEDFYRTCAYYKADGKIVRLNDVAPRTRYYIEPGGNQEIRFQDAGRVLEREGCLRVVADFPEYATMYVRKKTGIPEIRLRDRGNSASIQKKMKFSSGHYSE